MLSRKRDYQHIIYTRISSMIEKKIPYQRLRHFSYLIKEYLDQSDKVKGLYHRFPSIENFEGQIVDKAGNFPNKNRILLHDVVKMQYEELSDTKATSSNINLLKNETSFTIRIPVLQSFLNGVVGCHIL